MVSQSRNVQRAELNYEFAVTRLREGVSSRLEERQASDLLDDSQLNYNRAVFDYLVAQANFETAVGASVTTADDGMVGIIDSP
jgi:outer membrane protein TolC